MTLNQTRGHIAIVDDSPYPNSNMGDLGMEKTKVGLFEYHKTFTEGQKKVYGVKQGKLLGQEQIASLHPRPCWQMKDIFVDRYRTSHRTASIISIQFMFTTYHSQIFLHENHFRIQQAHPGILSWELK